MKFQITCDNCGTKFIIDAEEGATVECKCPQCTGLMEITFPLVSQGEEYVPQSDTYSPDTSLVGAQEMPTTKSHKWIWIMVILLAIVALSLGAYYGMQPANDTPTTPQPVVTDTIPYNTPVEEQIEPSVQDTVESQPKPKEEIIPEHEEPEEYIDTTATDMPNHDEQGAVE